MKQIKKGLKWIKKHEKEMKKIAKIVALVVMPGGFVVLGGILVKKFLSK